MRGLFRFTDGPFSDQIHGQSEGGRSHDHIQDQLYGNCDRTGSSYGQLLDQSRDNTARTTTREARSQSVGLNQGVNQNAQKSLESGLKSLFSGILTSSSTGQLRGQIQDNFPVQRCDPRVNSRKKPIRENDEMTSEIIPELLREDPEVNERKE